MRPQEKVAWVLVSCLAICCILLVATAAIANMKVISMRSVIESPDRDSELKRLIEDNRIRYDNLAREVDKLKEE